MANWLCIRVCFLSPGSPQPVHLDRCGVRDGWVVNSFGRPKQTANSWVTSGQASSNTPAIRTAQNYGCAVADGGKQNMSDTAGKCVTLATTTTTTTVWQLLDSLRTTLNDVVLFQDHKHTLAWHTFGLMVIHRKTISPCFGTSMSLKSSSVPAS